MYKEERDVKMTSAVANKLLKQLEEEKEYWVEKEKESCVYIAAVSEKPVVPNYDYAEVAGKIAEIDEKIARIKHAINLANVNSTVSVAGKEMSVDRILVIMAQKNKRKAKLDYMRKQQPKMRVEEYSFRHSNSREPEYQYINYDLDTVREDFERVTKEIMEMQLALDRHNQTFQFEIDI